METRKKNNLNSVNGGEIKKADPYVCFYLLSVCKITFERLPLPELVCMRRAASKHAHMLVLWEKVFGPWQDS